MTNPKQLLANFYLDLLALPASDSFRINHQYLYAAVRDALAKEFNEDAETVQNIFEKLGRAFND